MDSFFIFILLGFLIWFWFDSIGAKEKARLTCREYCTKGNVQFLDDTVALSKLRFRRNRLGRLNFYRVFKFEFSSNGDDRYNGKVALLGQFVEKVQMDAYPIIEG
ncbi:MAG: DUF3301 domain-containing protein [Gammaproteobacteria bacterium]|nr:DUF3301 domain-containing protein [Gammaproteobacteria bacterium]